MPIDIELSQECHHDCSIKVSYHFKYRWWKTAQYYDIECLHLALLAVNILLYSIHYLILAMTIINYQMDGLIINV